MPTTSLSTPISLHQAQQKVEDYLYGYTKSQILRSDTIHSNYAHLWTTIAEYLLGNGKRLRPYVVLLSYQSFGGTDIESALPVAISWELLHASLLIHDDIIDRDLIRHGKPNIAGHYLSYYQETIDQEGERLHYASSAALLAGDMLLSGAYQTLFDRSLGAEIVSQLVALLSQATFEVGGGELLDSESSFNAPSTADPLLIADHKTASYTFVGPLLSGAILAGMSDQTVQNTLKSLGILLGRGFQVVDDYIGLFGDSQTTGKSITSDLTEAKRTAVVTTALELLSPSDRSDAEVLLSNTPLSKAAVAKLKAYIDATNTKTVLKTQIAAYMKQCQDLIATLPLDSNYQKALCGLVDTVLNRQA